MNIIIPIKRVIDAYVNIRIKADGSGVETKNVKMAINPFDEIALEAGLRLKEARQAQSVTALSIGSEDCQESLRTALALGVDQAIHVYSESHFEPLNIAKILAAVIERQPADLVILGKQAIDDDNNQTAQMLAGLLDWPQATFASNIELSTDNVRVTREVDGGLDQIQCQLPAVLSTDLRLNEPRYPSLPNIMRARNKPIERIELNSLGLNLHKHYELLKITAPQARQKGKIVASVDDLVVKLRHEKQVIE